MHNLCMRKALNEALQTQDSPGHRVIGFVDLKAPGSALLRGSPLCESGETKSVQLLLAFHFRTGGAWAKILPAPIHSRILAPTILVLELLLRR